MTAAVMALIKLVGRAPRPVPWLGRGTFDHEVEAASEYQKALIRLAGGERRKGVTKDVTARLDLDDKNRYDNQAVRVSVQGRTVGYLSAGDARSYRKRIKEAGYEHNPGICDAIIVGGRKKGIDQKEHFGIVLDLPTTGMLVRKNPEQK